MSDAYKIGDVEIEGLTAEQKQLLDMVAAGKSLREISGLKRSDVERIYATGFNLYQNGKYAEAEPLFEFVCLNGSTDSRYWVALGSCRQMMKSYQGAIDAYGFGYLHGQDNPWPVINSAICYLALADKDNAKDALTLAEQTIAQGTPDNAATQRIAALRQAL
jgi:type III secretion system low calcium response chaperone LcrH/SycD